MPGVKTAIAGVGNAASAFIQALGFYSSSQSKEREKFISFYDIGGITIPEIDIVAAFDIDKDKVGKKLHDAIFAPINVTKQYVDKSTIERFDITVKKAPVLDGINPTASSILHESTEPEVDVVKELKESGAEIVICLLPSGAVKAVEYFANAAVEANCAFINATPTEIASNREIALKFKKAGLPLVGDDLQSLLGGTRLHKGILEVLNAFGAQLVNTYNLDVSGGTEALITLDSGLRTQMMKSRIKSESIRRIVPYLSKDEVVTGTTDYLDFLGSLRIGHFWIKALDFLGGEVHIDLTVKSDDGPNAAGTLVDVVRATKLALNRALDGPITSICAYGFKMPPQYMSESDSIVAFKEFIAGRRSD